MATNQPLPDREPPRAADPVAAQQLAAALRRARLTLLCGEAGAGKSALLVDGLLPQLRRRGSDSTVSVARHASPTVLPFPERRTRDERAGLAEFVILLNAWDAPSQASLHDGIDAALRAAHVDPEWYREPLAERVQSLSSRFGTRFLFVLDGFEAVLRATNDDPARAELLDELVQLLNTPLPANLLIALRADAELLLAPLLDRLHAVRPEVLVLEGGRMRRVYGQATPPPPPAASAPVPVPVPPAVAKPPPTEFSPFDRAWMPEAANTGAPTRPGAVGDVLRGRPSPAPAALPPFKALPKASRQYRSTTRRLAALASVALVAIVAGAALWRAGLPSGNYPPIASTTPAETIAAASPAAAALPASPAVVAAAPAVVATPPAPSPSPATSPRVSTPPPAAALPAPPPAVPPGRTSLALRVDADNAQTRLPRELAQALAAEGRAEVRVVPTALALPGRATGAAGLAVVRYDALQAAARAGTKTDLAIVAPLYTEELQIVVRADSPLRFIHQIEGKRLNVGAASGARALTARAVYRQMFDRPLPAAKQGSLDAAPALERLLAGDDLDAVVLVGPQPAAALAALPPAQRRGVRLLALAPDNPASRRALQTYLPATLREPAAGAATPTLAAMSFLVTTGQPDADTAATLGQLAGSLCRHLPGLQREGDAKWRELRAGLQLDTGLPPAGAADAAWRACAGAGLSSAARPGTASPATPTRN